jgi:hypothetical protein
MTDVHRQRSLTLALCSLYGLLFAGCIVLLRGVIHFASSPFGGDVDGVMTDRAAGWSRAASE